MEETFEDVAIVVRRTEVIYFLLLEPLSREARGALDAIALLRSSSKVTV